MEVGHILEARFVIERLAGRGGMGVVYRAHDRQSGQPVAVKVLHGRRGGDRARFEREAQILAGLDDPRVVKLVAHGNLGAHGVGADGDSPYLVMEWLDGEDLASRLSRERMGVAEALRLAGDIAAALGELHDRGIVHRDLKPSNVFLCAGGLKLLDFGIAQLEHATRVTATGALIGTVGYMAPEQAKAGHVLDPRSDVFALGCLLFECLAGEPAFVGEQFLALLTRILFDDTPRLRDRCAAVPPELGVLLERLLTKDPAARPADGRAAATLLAELPAYGEAPLDRLGQEAPSTALTTSEQRTLAVILMGVPVGAGTSPPGDIHWLEAEARVHGASFERLRDGSIAMLLASSQVATDLAAQAAQCALALGRRAPDRPIALAMGKSRTTDRLPMGPAIDRAALLLGRDAKIAVDEIAAGLLDARFDVRDDGKRHTLVAERDVAEVRTLLGRATPCVGRERELRGLDALFSDCTGQGGGAQVALVTGPPGVGKSRLGREFLQRARAIAAPSVWTARGEPVRAGTALGMLAGLVQSAAGIRGGEPVHERRQRLAARVAEHVAQPEHQQVTEFLGELVGAAWPAEESLPLRAARNDAQLMNDQIRHAFQVFLAAECHAGPVLLLLEDVHWGDASTVQALDRALGELEEAPLFVLALARPEVHENFPGLWSQRLVQEVRMRELPRKAAERLVRHVLGDERDPELIERIVSLSEGNAFYLEELIRVAAEGPRPELPETVVAMVESRIAARPDDERRLLRAASVFGETFWSGAVVALVAGEAREAERAFERLVEVELIIRRPASRFGDDAEYAFRHALLREGAYAMLTDADKALGHRLAGEWLERHGEDDALVLARHFDAGGDGLKGGELYLRAAERAGLGGDTLGAIACIERGLACPAAAEVRTRLLGMSCQLHYHRVEIIERARPHADELDKSAAPGSAPWAQARLVHLTSAVKEGRMADFVAASQPVIEQSFSADAHEPASLTLATICYLFDLGGQLPLANAAFARFEEVARAAADHAPSVTALYHLYDSLRRPLAHEDPWGGREQARIAYRTARAIGHRKYASVAELFGALNAWLLGWYDEALAEARAADAFADESGFASATRPFMLAWLHSDLGRFDEAVAHAERLVSSGQSRGLPLDQARGHWVLGEVLRRAGDTSRARASIDTAVALLRMVAPLDLPGALATQAHLQLALGDEAALATAREGMALVRQIGVCSQFMRRSFLELAHIEALRASGHDARGAITASCLRLEGLAVRLGEGEHRRRFLSEVPENRRLMELGAAR